MKEADLETQIKRFKKKKDGGRNHRDVHKTGYRYQKKGFVKSPNLYRT